MTGRPHNPVEETVDATLERWDGIAPVDAPSDPFSVSGNKRNPPLTSEQFPGVEDGLLFTFPTVLDSFLLLSS